MISIFKLYINTVPIYIKNMKFWFKKYKYNLKLHCSYWRNLNFNVKILYTLTKIQS